MLVSPPPGPYSQNPLGEMGRLNGCGGGLSKWHIRFKR